MPLLLLSVIGAFTTPHGQFVVVPGFQDGAWLLVLAVFCTLI